MADLTIEFAGLGVAVVKNDQVEVLLPDAEAAGGPPHQTVLLVEDHWFDKQERLIGSPDFTVTLPGSEREYAGWHLRGSVTLSAPSGRSSADFKDLADLKEISDGQKLVEPNLRPIRASIALPMCSVRGTGLAHHVNFFYPDPNNPNKTLQVYKSWRSLKKRMTATLKNAPDMVRVAFDGADGGRKVIGIASRVGSLVISNLTSGSVALLPHFDAFYELVDNPARRPQIKRKPKSTSKRDEPINPDECRIMWF